MTIAYDCQVGPALTNLGEQVVMTHTYEYSCWSSSSLYCCHPIIDCYQLFPDLIIISRWSQPSTTLAKGLLQLLRGSASRFISIFIVNKCFHSFFIFYVLLTQYQKGNSSPPKESYIGQRVIFSIHRQTSHRRYIFLLPLTNAHLTSGWRLGGRFGGHCERVSDVQGAPRS